MQIWRRKVTKATSEQRVNIQNLSSNHRDWNRLNTFWLDWMTWLTWLYKVFFLPFYNCSPSLFALLKEFSNTSEETNKSVWLSAFSPRRAKSEPPRRVKSRKLRLSPAICTSPRPSVKHAGAFIKQPGRPIQPATRAASLLLWGVNLGKRKSNSFSFSLSKL